MREIALAGLNAVTSCLGFGCASLGSRVSAAQGARALAAAYEGGVRWFDIAPAYGSGMAEPILGAFLKGRGEVQICTKVGLLPPAQSSAKRLARSLLRPVVAAAGPLRAAIRKSGAMANTGVALTPDLLQTSLERSLTRLGVEQVAVYALHNAAPADLARDDILRTLEDLRSTGKTRALAVAGGADVAEAALVQGAPFDVIQLAQPATPDIIAQAQRAGTGCVTHTVFGVAGSLAALTARLKTDAVLAARLAQAGFDGPPDAAASQLLMARAFAVNPQGVVLASMFSDLSLTRNLASAAAPLHADVVALFAELGI